MNLTFGYTKFFMILETFLIEGDYMPGDIDYHVIAVVDHDAPSLPHQISRPGKASTNPSPPSTQDRRNHLIVNNASALL